MPLLRRVLAYLSCFFQAPILLVRVHRLESQRAQLYQSNLDLTDQLRELQSSFSSASAERSTALILLEAAEARADKSYTDSLQSSRLIADYFAQRTLGRPIFGPPQPEAEPALSPPPSRVQARRLAQRETQDFLAAYTNQVREAMQQEQANGKANGDGPTGSVGNA
jgi:hypothetical protein